MKLKKKYEKDKNSQGMNIFMFYYKLDMKLSSDI